MSPPPSAGSKEDPLRGSPAKLDVLDTILLDRFGPPDLVVQKFGRT